MNFSIIEYFEESQIKKCYKFIGYLNLVLSILCFFIISEIELFERFFTLIAINVVYHMCYFFFSSIYKVVEKVRMKNNFMRAIGGIQLSFFAIFGVLSSLFLLYVFLHQAITLKEYFNLFLLCIPFGIMLGSINLWISVKNE